MTGFERTFLMAALYCIPQAALGGDGNEMATALVSAAAEASLREEVWIDSGVPATAKTCLISPVADFVPLLMTLAVVVLHQYESRF